MPNEKMTLVGGSFLPLLRRIGQEYARRVRKWKLPFPVISALMEIAMHPDHAEPAALAEATTIPRQTMTSLLDALEQRGLAKRNPHPEDRRRKVLALTAKGQALAREIYEDALTFEAKAMETFSVNEMVQMRKKISTYVDLLAQQNDATSKKGK